MGYIGNKERLAHFIRDNFLSLDPEEDGNWICLNGGIVIDISTGLAYMGEIELIQFDMSEIEEWLEEINEFKEGKTVENYLIMQYSYGDSESFRNMIWSISERFEEGDTEESPMLGEAVEYALKNSNGRLRDGWIYSHTLILDILGKEHLFVGCAYCYQKQDILRVQNNGTIWARDLLTNNKTGEYNKFGNHWRKVGNVEKSVIEKWLSQIGDNEYDSTDFAAKIKNKNNEDNSNQLYSGLEV
jgi:hypothetical protein